MSFKEIIAVCSQKRAETGNDVCVDQRQSF